MTTLLELSVFPVGEGESVSAQVAAVVALIRDSGIPYRLTSMGTIIRPTRSGARSSWSRAAASSS